MLREMGQAARRAARKLARATSAQKDQALKAIATQLRAKKGQILEANQKDLETARAAGMSPNMLDRLSLEGHIEAIADGVLAVAELADPVGEVYDEHVLPNGLEVRRQRTPIGVLGVIYEARPNVTIDVAALAIKTSNCAILRGGKEAVHSNYALAAVVQEGIADAGLPKEIIQIIPTPEREQVLKMLHLHEYIDLIIPRGGAGLHTFCRDNSTIPVITGGIGVCHLFVDESANLEKALVVVDNAKTQRPTVCNALDTLLIHEAVQEELLPLLVKRFSGRGVALSVDQSTFAFLQRSGLLTTLEVRKAQENDWDREWLGLTLGVRVVPSIDEAIAHIQKHSSGHSDGILTQDEATAQRFVNEIDSAAVYVNASTRFTDGGELGLGAEVAVSTQKLHARGPMGLRELTTYKWVIRGDYQARD